MTVFEWLHRFKNDYESDDPCTIWPTISWNEDSVIQVQEIVYSEQHQIVE